MPYIGLSVKYRKKKKNMQSTSQVLIHMLRDKKREGKDRAVFGGDAFSPSLLLLHTCNYTFRLDRGVNLVDSSQSFQGMYCTAEEFRHTPSGGLRYPMLSANFCNIYKCNLKLLLHF